MPWEIELTPDFKQWYHGLDQGTKDRIIAAVRVLRRIGPGLGRPLVDSVKGSALSMKELRVGTIRVLFAFDPRRVGVLLVGGDKQDRWERWYREAIPKAERVYKQHLAKIEDDR